MYYSLKHTSLTYIVEKKSFIIYQVENILQLHTLELNINEGSVKFYHNLGGKRIILKNTNLIITYGTNGFMIINQVEKNLQFKHTSLT